MKLTKEEEKVRAIQNSEKANTRFQNARSLFDVVTSGVGLILSVHARGDADAPTSDNNRHLDIIPESILKRRKQEVI